MCKISTIFDVKNKLIFQYKKVILFVLDVVGAGESELK
jgi:hypothetical protein